MGYIFVGFGLRLSRCKMRIKKMLKLNIWRLRSQLDQSNQCDNFSYKSLRGVIASSIIVQLIEVVQKCFIQIPKKFNHSLIVLSVHHVSILKPKSFDCSSINRTHAIFKTLKVQYIKLDSRSIELTVDCFIFLANLVF